MFSAVDGFRYTSDTGGDPYWNYVTYLENFENPGLFTKDSSTNNWAVTFTGTGIVPNLSTPFASGAGGSSYWPGATNYITMPASANWNLTNGLWTFECWVYCPTFTPQAGVFPLLAYGTGAFNNIRMRPTGFILEGAPSSSVAVNFPSSMVVNTWYHIALVRSSTSTVTAYLNGVAGTPVTTFTTSNTYGSSSAVVEIGYKSDPQYFYGFMSNWRLVKGTAVYTTGFTPPTSPLTAISGTVGLFNFTNQGTVLSTPFVDQSPQLSTITLVDTSGLGTGLVTYAGISPFGNTYTSYSMFTGYLTVAASAAYTYGTGDFTIEFWVYSTASVANNYFYDQRTAGGTTVTPVISTNGSSQLLYTVNGSIVITGSTALAATTWYHVAVARTGTSTKMFLNGVQEGSTYSDSNNYVSSPVNFGGNSNATTQGIQGYMTNVRVSKGFCYYTTTFTPSTIPLTVNMTYTKLLATGSTAGFIDSSNTKNLPTVTTLSATYPVYNNQIFKFGSQSGFMNTSGYLSVVNNAGLQFNGNFTIELWIYRPSIGAAVPVLNKNQSVSANGWTLSINASNQLLWISGSSTLKTSTTTIPATTWTYIAITRNGTTGYMFINGNLEGSTFTDSADYSANTSGLRIGLGSVTVAPSFNGYMDDIRLTKGICRYAASFTPPASAFPTF